jgi:predicted ATPase with chaperone activity
MLPLPVAVGELGLDGTVRSVRGLLPRLAAVPAGTRTVLVPAADVDVATRFFPDLPITGVGTFADAVTVIDHTYDTTQEDK